MSAEVNQRTYFFLFLFFIFSFFFFFFFFFLPITYSAPGKLPLTLSTSREYFEDECAAGKTEKRSCFLIELCERGSPEPAGGGGDMPGKPSGENNDLAQCH